MRRSTLIVLALLAATIPLTAAQPAPLTFANYAAPTSLGAKGGEPSIGVNWNSGAVMLLAGTVTMNFDTATKAWRSVGAPLTSVATLDPILFTDTKTGRTFVSQLYDACSLLAYSDDDGASWIQHPLGCGLNAGQDHQSIGGGAYAGGASGSLYPHSVYYCSNAPPLNTGSATCSVSTDGGLSFASPSKPLHPGTQCWGLHGHLRVAPDGTAYVPNSNCGGKQGLVVSTNNGGGWLVRTIPGTGTQRESDPSVAVGALGRAYYCYQDADGHAKVTTTTNRGQSWSPIVDVSAPLGVVNTQFQAAIAGDDDRAACAFIGTTTPGDDQPSSFQGSWHLYVAVTYDAGATWTTVDATPSDPVQTGCVWLQGGSNACRNLLDFNDIAVLKDGRVIVAYADGCTTRCGQVGAPRSALATVALQTAGLGLFSEYD